MNDHSHVQDWMKAVPAHWEAPLLKLVARVESGHTPSRSHPEYWVPDECTVPWFSLADIWQLRNGRQKHLGDTKEKLSPLGIANSGARILPPGTVVLSRTASVGFSGVMPGPMATTQDFVNFVCGPRLSHDFLLWVLRGMKPEFERLRRGSTHKTIYMPDALQFRTPLPPLPTQKTIADFLDRRTSAIDGLIEKKQKLLALLAEKRAALIEEVLAKLGAPEVRLAYVVDLLPGLAFPSSSFTQDASGIPLVRGINVVPGRLRWDDVVRWPQDEVAGLETFLLQPRDLVIGMDRPWISSGFRLATVRAGDCPCLLLQRVARLRCKSRATPEYLRLALEGRRFRAHLEPETTGVSVPHISGDQILSYRLPLPPLAEQERVAGELDAFTVAQDSVARTILAQIERLREYRQVLITAAVTGQLDIGAAA